MLKVVLPSVYGCTGSVATVNSVRIINTPPYQYTNHASKHVIESKSVFNTSHVNTSPVPAIVALNSPLPL